MLKIKAFAISALGALALSACAPAIPVQSVQLTPITTTHQRQRMRVVTPVTVRLTTGYSRRVKGGSVWRPVGELPQGFVFQPVNSVFTIEGRQVHEAYLVVKEDQLVGFFLPGEAHFSALTPTQPLTLERINE